MGSGGVRLQDRNRVTTLTFDERDSAPFMPKCVVVDPEFRLEGRARPAPVPWEHTVVYEMHLRGYTKLHPEIAKRMARHLARAWRTR